MPQFVGPVRWFNNAKGYGFLGRNDGGPDVFAHYTSIQKTGYKSLKEGEIVSFDIVKGEKGPQADNVVPFVPQNAAQRAPMGSVQPLTPQQRHHA